MSTYINKLNSEQKRIFDKMVNGENIFLTGNAGTGKSFLVNAYVEYCEKNDIKVLKSAPTGIAACNIKGMTLHRLFNLKIDIESMLKEVKSIPESVEKKLSLASTLLIDEISMVRIDLFDKVMQYIFLENEERREKNCKPIQLIFVGDFFQLAPVISKEQKSRLDLHYGCDIGQGFAFQSKFWHSMNVQFEKLTEVIRQDDKEFCNALDKCKYGDDNCISFFNTKTADKVQEKGVWVCGKNATAYERNKEKLNEIHKTEYISKAEYSGKATKSDGLCEDSFSFKEGARVIMTSNDTNGLYQNGSMGTIKSAEGDKDEIKEIDIELDNGRNVKIKRQTFSKYEYVEKEIKTISKDEDGNEIVKSHSELALEEIGSAKQFPMKLGYAVTVHKAQGQTFDSMNFIPEIFQDGQLYVALSRCKSADKLYILGNITSSMVRTSQEVVKYYENPETYSFFGKDNDIITIQIEQKNEKVVKEMIKCLDNHREEVNSFIEMLSLRDRSVII